MRPGRVVTGAACAAIGAAVLAGCGSDGSGGEAGQELRTPSAPSASAPVPSTTAVPMAPETVTVTESPPPPPTVTTVVPPPPPPPPAATTVTAPPPPAQDAPATSIAVLNAYFDAVNLRDYARAWQLGGPVFASAYEQFVNDHATTAHYDLTVLAVDDGVVSAAMDVTQTDGSHRYYQGTYTVRAGAIAASTMHEVARGPAPGAPGTTPSPPAQGPYDFDYCAQAWAAGVAPITSGQPGYRAELDRDHDGVACEPSPTASTK